MVVGMVYSLGLVFLGVDPSVGGMPAEGDDASFSGGVVPASPL